MKIHIIIFISCYITNISAVRWIPLDLVIDSHRSKEQVFYSKTCLQQVTEGAHVLPM